MTGDIGEFIPGVVDDPVYDPAIVKDPSNQTYHVFSTGVLRNPQDPGGIFVRRSTGSLAGPWESLGEIAVPEWTRGSTATATSGRLRSYARARPTISTTRRRRSGRTPRPSGWRPPARRATWTAGKTTDPS